MRKFLTIFGAIALVGLLALGGFIGWAAYRGSALDRESKAFVDSAVPAIARNWDRQELLDRAAPELRDKATPQQLGIVFNALARLGPMLAYEGAKGDAVMSYMSGSGSTVTANYVATARFQNGAAVFHVGAVKRDDHWMIFNFHVEPAPTASAKPI